MTINKQDTSNKYLIEAAIKAKVAAHAPYSKFGVGAAVLAKSGKIFSGCNVENISLGLTICAERSAIAAAVSGGARDLTKMAESRRPGLPCGACRQVMAEFNPGMQIVAATISCEVKEYDLSELLPNPNQGVFESD
jgi:cytidine deaminase